MPINTTTVTGPILDIEGNAYTNATIRFLPRAPGGDAGEGATLADTPVDVIPNASTGEFSVDLAPSDSIPYDVSLIQALPDGEARYPLGGVLVTDVASVSLQELLADFDQGPEPIPTVTQLNAAVAAAEADANRAEAAKTSAQTEANSAETQAGIAQTQADLAAISEANAAASAVAAAAATGTFENTADGLAATSNGDYFFVVISSGGLRIYRNSGGSASLQGSIGDFTVQSDPYDGATGKMLAVGAFGLGADGNAIVADLDAALASGFYNATAGTTQNMPAGSANQNAVLVAKANSQNGFQLFFNRTSDSLLFRRYESGSWGAWGEVYDKNNIVGSVSESANIPTGAVLERGSNANGEYVRWADGTQMCILEGIDLDYIAADRLGYDWTFPAQFEPGTAIATSITRKIGAHVNCLTTDIGADYIAAKTSSSLILGYTGAGASPFIATSQVTDVTVTAIGRWF